ncbi:hypothetical protein [Mesorhizobium sp. M0130]|uniref:hypothetical protein n=1 Tax=Mesorhizobium sp. M0130 TaxID=2956887 RepID=UPI00333596DF
MNMAARTDRRANNRHLAWSVALDVAPTLLGATPHQVVGVSLAKKTSACLCAIHPACACLVNQKTDHLQDQDQQKKAKGRRQNSCLQDDALFLTHSSPGRESDDNP